jgi:hypothetical protein
MRSLQHDHDGMGRFGYSIVSGEREHCRRKTSLSFWFQRQPADSLARLPLTPHSAIPKFAWPFDRPTLPCTRILPSVIGWPLYDWRIGRRARHVEGKSAVAWSSSLRALSGTRRHANLRLWEAGQPTTPPSQALAPHAWGLFFEGVCASRLILGPNVTTIIAPQSFC